MFKFALTAAAALFSTSSAETDQLHFVHEIVRHGARASTTNTDGFTVNAGQLTASGMRQRFPLGTANRKRYIEQYGLLSSKEEIYVQTTSYDRTFQSGFSELMGMFPPSSLKEDEKLSMN